MTKKFKVRPVIDSLREKFPGDWKYNPSSCRWELPDGSYLCRVLTGKDFDGEYDGTWSWCLYWANKSPEWVYL